MPVTNDLSGRVAVVTGASSGIGEQSARLLAAQGATVALLARRADKLEAIAADIRATGGTALPLAVDVRDSSALKQAAVTVQERLGTASILFNNAGVMLPAPIEEHREDEWQLQIALNISGVVLSIGAFVDQLVETAAAGKPADLISTSSIAGQYLYPNFAIYSASKAFVSHLTRHLRAELGPKGVRVGEVAPGIVGTELQSHVTDQGALDWLAGAKESMTWLTGEDVAEVVTFMVSLPAHVNLQQVTVMPTGQAS
jgi:NADP-dependent 3-hydroxy acid dehydrogenase YdfG